MLLWHKLATAAPILPLAWELPYGAGAAPKKKKDTHTHKYIYSLHTLKQKLSGILFKLAFSFIRSGSFTVTGYRTLHYAYVP